MNLPFSPTFFRKIDIYQQLTEYENQAKEKHLWEGEKAVLIWGASDQHQFLDKGLKWEHVKEALNYCLKKKFITEFEKNELSKPGLRTHTIRALPVHGFGDPLDKDDSRIRINRNGILAGRILVETNFLKNTWRYQIWIIVWWVILGIATVILVSQLISSLRGIYSTFIPVQEKHNNYRDYHQIFYNQHFKHRR